MNHCYEIIWKGNKINFLTKPIIDDTIFVFEDRSVHKYKKIQYFILQNQYYTAMYNITQY